jgi:predicted neuraminidase
MNQATFQGSSTMNPVSLRLAVLLILCSISNIHAEGKNDPALKPAEINTNPGPEYGDDTRIYQGVPGLERTQNGRLWILWYAGGLDEGDENYVVLVTSGNDGKTWSGPKLVIDIPGPVRAYDPTLWHDPSGRLWLFWAKSYSLWDGRSGVWAIVSSNSDDENPTWSKPRRISNGIMMNKPTVLSTGEWLLPVSVWSYKIPASLKHQHHLPKEQGGNIVISRDQGKSFQHLGQTRVPNRTFDEHMIIERKNDLWTLVRTSYGIGESISTDGGQTWSKGNPSGIPHINARFFIRRLISGNLLLVRHVPRSPESQARENITAFISDDDGKTWKGGLLLDKRPGVAYPDGVQSADGNIYITHDFSRQNHKEILMSIFTEADVLAGKAVSGKIRLKILVNKATGTNK